MTNQEQDSHICRDRFDRSRFDDTQSTLASEADPTQNEGDKKSVTFSKGSLREERSAQPSKKGDARTARMGTGSIPKLIMEFAIPSIVGMLVNGAYNVIDSIFLGQAMGEIGLSVATAAMPLMTIFMALAMLIGNGGNALAALRLGEGNKAAAEKSLGNTVCLGIIAALLVAVLIHIPPCVEAILTLSSVTPEIRDYTYSFMYILALGFIFQLIGMGVNNFIRTAGAPNRALATMVIGTISCIVFNYLFVLVFGWGVVGSALATVLGQAISCVCVLWYFLFTKDVAFKLYAANLKLEAEVVGLIISLGAASFVMQLAMSVINFLVNYLLVLYGGQSPLGAEAALASIGVVQRCAMFTVLPLIGIAVAIQPLLGFNYGASLISRVRSTLGYGILIATIMGTIMWALLHIFAFDIVSFFGIRDDALREFTVFALNVQVLVLPVVGMQIVTSNYFQATGQPIKSVILSLTRQVLFLIPLYIVLPLVLPRLVPTLTSLDALYFAVPIADILAVVTSLIFIFFELKRLKGIEEGTIQAKLGKKNA